MQQTAARTAALTIAALCAFAANSLLCRLALSQEGMDPATFTTIRVFSGAGVLTFIWLLGRPRKLPRPPDWRAVLALFVYMICFSFAYVTLGAATGALILFGTVQMTMFVAAIRKRERERFAGGAWLGLAIAIGGLVYLLSPGLTAPNPLGATLMIAAGVGWGVYSLLGRHAGNPLATTTMNFIAVAPLVLAITVVAGQVEYTRMGILVAVVSGAIASGCGYVIWYAALRGLTASRAAVVQLSVPVIAALGAVAVLSEPITMRLIIASVATIGGVALVLSQRTTRSPQAAD